jgi:hypothetical protein
MIVTMARCDRQTHRDFVAGDDRGEEPRTRYVHFAADAIAAATTTEPGCSDVS